MSQCLLPRETKIICKTGLQPGNCWYSGASRSSVGSGFLRDAGLGSCPSLFPATKRLQGTGVGWELSLPVAASPGDIPWPCWGQCHHQAPPPGPTTSPRRQPAHGASGASAALAAPGGFSIPYSQGLERICCTPLHKTKAVFLHRTLPK